ncbi:transcription factor bHLH94 [Brachypodium distachyon]|nr:transcription factor bHLH94 [Brachypodium distachyon]|eukprot:XP_003561963.1 transcription factor bHLH94 [Brachypodium distachyon]
MALEAVVFAQQDAHGHHLGYGGAPPGSSWESSSAAPASYTLAPWCDDDGLAQAGAGSSGSGGLSDIFEDWDNHHRLAAAASVEDQFEAGSKDQYQSSDAYSTEGNKGKAPAQDQPAVVAGAAAGRRKRRRAKVVKNKEEVECQRRTHIAVERNRRRQMNDYLAGLRSLMPPSYAQRGDQASIVGGAINYVKELEQLLQSLEVQKSVRSSRDGSRSTDPGGRSPFAGFFTFPQYSTIASSAHCSPDSSGVSNACHNVVKPEAGVADIEVTMAEGHASLKVLVRRLPRQLLKLVAGLQQLRVPALHLNVTTLDTMALYSFSLKVEDGSKLGSVEDIAAAVHEILARVQREEEEEAQA